ncbi:MAG TPA: DNRLRE domain-containing protein, partial [Polyangia bacterium]|nr:DNRLRE domain-containing protein [Polyangia bacterium]
MLCACAKGNPETGAEIHVVNGEGVPRPSYLLFDWKDGNGVLVRDRRVPASGALDPAAQPLAIIRIAADDVQDPQRTITVRGMIDDLNVSRAEGPVRIAEGAWVTTTVVLAATTPVDADAGAPADGPEQDGGSDAGDDASDDASDDAGPPDVPSDIAPPPDTTPPDLGRDLGPDLPRDLPPDLPPAMVAISAAADSFVEQGQSSAGMNFGKNNVLEVKTQAGADNNRIAFLRFSLAAVTGTTTVTATLRVHGKASAGTSMDSAYGVTDETWTESGINWNNKPAMGAKLATLPVGTTGQYREWNVTAFVKAQQAAGRDNVNFAIGMDNDTSSGPDTFSSR